MSVKARQVAEVSKTGHTTLNTDMFSSDIKQEFFFFLKEIHSLFSFLEPMIFLAMLSVFCFSYKNNFYPAFNSI